MDKARLFEEFLTSGDVLRLYAGERLIFRSEHPGVRGLVAYIRSSKPVAGDITVFDRVVGNAAALLIKKLACREVFSRLGSQAAAKTLAGYGISYHFTETVPAIQNRDKSGLCPMEQLSLGKGPEEFYQACLALGIG